MEEMPANTLGSFFKETMEQSNQVKQLMETTHSDLNSTPAAVPSHFICLAKEIFWGMESAAPRLEPVYSPFPICNKRLLA